MAITLVAILVSRRIWPSLFEKDPSIRALPPPEPTQGEAWPPGVNAARNRRVAEARAGEYIAVVGRVVDATPLHAPLSQRRCAAFDLVVSTTVGGDRCGRLLRGTSFTLDDDSGLATVDARGAYVRVRHDSRIDGAPVDALRDQLELTLEPGFPALGLSADEGVIGIGDTVLVIGVAEELGEGGDAGYRTSASTRLRIAGGRDRAALVSNVPDDVRARA
jgi:hypothetical protein